MTTGRLAHAFRGVWHCCRNAIECTDDRTGSLNDFDAHENVNQATNASHADLMRALSKQLRDIVDPK